MGQQCCHPPPSGHANLTTSQEGTRSGRNETQSRAAATSHSPAPPLDAEDESWVISYSDLQFMNITGKDYLGPTWKGKWKATEEVEIRTLALDKKGACESLAEAKLLRGLRHPHLLNVVGMCREGRQMHVVSERPFSVSLLQHWLGRVGHVASPLLLHLLAQVASGLAYLEEHALLYLEPSARNALMTSNLVCKLEVRGLVRRFEDVQIADLQLPFMSTAPEVSTSGSISMKSSVWTFGVFMLEVVNGGQLHIYEYMSNQEVMLQVNKGLGFPPPNNCPHNLYELMKKCWVLPPEKRPTFTSLRDSLEDAAAGYSREDLEMCVEAL